MPWAELALMLSDNIVQFTSSSALDGFFVLRRAIKSKFSTARVPKLVSGSAPESMNVADMRDEAIITALYELSRYAAFARFLWPAWNGQMTESVKECQGRVDEVLKGTSSAVETISSFANDEHITEIMCMQQNV